MRYIEFCKIVSDALSDKEKKPKGYFDKFVTTQLSTFEIVESDIPAKLAVVLLDVLVVYADYGIA